MTPARRRFFCFGGLLVTAACAALLLPADITLRSFDRVLLLEEQAETSANVSIGDLNGDGFPDLILAKGRHWPLHNRVLLNDGKGRFTAHNLGDTPDRTYTAAVADLNGDGFLDVVVSNDQPDRKLIYFGDGRGNFKVAGTYGDPAWSTRNITLADLNGDHHPDIVVANRLDEPGSPVSSYVCFNDGNGRFPSCRPLPGTESATTIVAADFDGDGATDLFIPHRDGGRSLILWNNGKGNFQPAPFGPAQTHARAAAAGDLNGDGLPDIVVGDERRGTFVFLNSGRRTFAAPFQLAPKDRVPYALAIADMNRDRKADVVLGCAGSPGAVFFNEGAGRAFREVRWNDGQGAVYGVAIGDLDGDGWPDIAAARSDARNGVWFNTPAKTRP